jgi:carboxypeptidase family protein
MSEAPLRLRNLRLIAPVLLSVWAPALIAQSAGTGALTGTVTDASRAVVPAVTVTLTNVDTNQARTAVTGADGNYKFSLIPPGTYRVRFSATGFKTADVSSVKINVTETPVLDQALEVGSQAEQVTVEAQTEGLQIASSTLGTVVGERTVTALPLSTRNYTQILGLSAGASGGVGNATAFGKGTLDLSVNGNDPGKNNYQIDGVAVGSMTNRATSQDLYGILTGLATPNPDAIQEFKVQTSTYDASYGRNPGANVNVVTKSGTNSFHGSAFEFFRNAQLNANDFFYNRDNPASQTTKQVLNQNQFGGTIGGPIKKDKLFFFGSYQGTRQRNGIAAEGLTSAYLPPIPAGDRSAPGFAAALAAANCGYSTLLPSFLSPQLACDGSNISPVALKILQAKNADGSYYFPGSGTNGYGQRSWSIPATNREDQVVANGDYLIDSKNTLAGRYFYSRNPQYSPLAGQLPGTPKSLYYSNTYSVLKLTSLVTNNLVNEARISYSYTEAVNLDQMPQGAQTSAQIGQTPISPTSAHPPQLIFIIGGYTAFGNLDPLNSPTHLYQYADQVSWSHGRHTIRAGFEFEKWAYNLVWPGIQNGILLIGSFNDLLVGQQGNILGAILSTRSGPNGPIHGYRMTDMSSFVQDDWKVNSHLTLNLGTRWEYDGTLSDKYANLTNIWLSRVQSVTTLPTGPTTGGAGFMGYVEPHNFPQHYGQPPDGVLINSNDTGLREHPPLSNFAPRIGMAWQPGNSGKLVIRAGAGVFYDRVSTISMSNAYGNNPPYAANVTYGFPNSQTLADPFPHTSLALQPRWANPATGQTSMLNVPFVNEVQHTPLVRQYNLNVQYQFLPSWILEAGYVGSSGINLEDFSHNYNTAQLASAAHPINGVTTNTVANTGYRVPYLGFAPTGLLGTGYDLISNYNSLQITLRKQFSHGFNMQAAYTWSKSLTNSTENSANYNNAGDLAQQYGPSYFNRPQRFIVNYNYELPFGNHPGALGKLTSGWSISGVTTIQNGQPLTIEDSNAGTIFGTSTGYTDSGIARAQMCPGMTYANIATPGGIEQRLGGGSGGPGYLNAKAFCPAPVIGDGTGFGNSGMGIVQGPGQFNFDFSVAKNTRLFEKQSLQFRAEFFNILNHPQFDNPNPNSIPYQPALPNISAPNFGQIVNTSVNPRVIQLALKYVF